MRCTLKIKDTPPPPHGTCVSVRKTTVQSSVLTRTSEFPEYFVEDLRLVPVGVESQECVLIGHYQLLELLDLPTDVFHQLFSKVLDPIWTNDLCEGLQLCEVSGKGGKEGEEGCG